MTTSIVLIDDHQVVREGIRVLLEQNPGLQVVGEAGTAQDGLSLIERLRPHILITDLKLPDRSGLEIIRQVRETWPRIRVIVLSMYADEAYVWGALRAGASGYVLKEGGHTELVRAIHEALRGQRYLCANIDQSALARFEQQASENLDPYETLTARERQVLQLAVKGLTSAQIGEQLDISPRTVEVHRLNLMRKLGLRTSHDLIRFAVQRGLLIIESQFQKSS